MFTIWCRDGKDVVSTLKVNITTKDDTSVLKISGITHKQSGQYKCVAVNPVGKAEHTATVTVTGKELLVCDVSRLVLQLHSSRYIYICMYIHKYTHTLWHCLHWWAPAGIFCYLLHNFLFHKPVCVWWLWFLISSHISLFILITKCTLYAKVTSESLNLCLNLVLI